MDSSLDSRSLGAFRIALGLLMLADLADRAQHLEFYTDEPYLSSLLPNGSTYWSLHALSGSLNGQIGWFIVAALAAISLTIGFKSQFSAAVCSILTLSLQLRNPFVCYGADDVLRLLLIWSCLLPIGHSYSWDSRHTNNQSTKFQSPVTLAFIFQIVMIFVLAGSHKVFDSTWREGHGILYGVAAFPGPLANQVLNHPTLFLFVNWIVMGFQFVVALGALHSSTRLMSAIGFIFLQVAMALTMDLNMFPFAVMVAWIPLLPASVWKSEPSVTVSTGKRWMAAALVGILIPLMCEWAENFDPSGTAVHFAVSVGLRQHWRMFTPPPTERMWFATNYLNGSQQNGVGWIGSRWGGLSSALGEDPWATHRMFQWLCDQPRGRAPAAIEHFKMYRLRKNIVGTDDSVQRETLIDHRCSTN